jgi:hypothetical protein
MALFRTPDKETRLRVAREIQSKGPLRLILVTGLLKWGALMAVFATGYEYFVLGYHDAIKIRGLEITGLIWLACGILYGLTLWRNVCRIIRQNDHSN